MQTKEITIHGALAELKVIDKRIEKQIVNFNPIGLAKTGKPVNNYIDEEVFNSDANKNWQSIQDLINYKQSLKSAVVKANALTTVTIGNDTMSIADAINQKTQIESKEQLLTKLQQQYNSIVAQHNKENERIENIALDNAKIILGKQGDNKVSATDEEVKNIVVPFVSRERFNIVDPLNLKSKIEELDNYITTFKAEIDAALSVINATTKITVEY